MEYLFSALHSLIASLFLCYTFYRTAITGTLTYFDVFLGVFILYVVFHNNNSSKKHLSLKDEDGNTGFFHCLFKAIVSIDFWLCALVIVLPVSLIVQIAWKTPFYGICCMLLPMLLVCEAQQCRRWAEAYRDYAELRVQPDVAEYVAANKARPFKKIVNMVLGCLAVGFIRVLLYLFRLTTPVLMFFAYEAGSMIILVLCAIPLALLLRGLFSMRKRRGAVKELAKLCTGYGYILKDNTKLFRGLYYSTGKTDVIIEKGSQRCLISFLPVPYKTSSVVFYADKKYNFCPRIFGINLSFPMHSVGFGEEEGDKYLVFTKPAARAKLWNGRNFMEIDNGEVIYGAKAYSVNAFKTYFDRLARKENASIDQ